MKKYDVFVNGVPVGEVEASSTQQARLIAREDSCMNEDNVPMDFIYAEEVCS